MEVVPQIEADPVTSKSNAIFTHNLCSTAFQRTQPINSNFRLDDLPPNPSSQIQNGDGDGDEFGDFKSVPAQLPNTSAHVEVDVHSGAARLPDLKSAPLSRASAACSTSSPIEQVRGFPFTYAGSRDFQMNFKASSGLFGIQDVTDFPFSSTRQTQTLDRHGDKRPDQTTDRNTSARPVETPDQSNSVPLDRSPANIGASVQSNGADAGTEIGIDDEWGDFVQTPVKEFRQENNVQVHGFRAFEESSIGSGGFSGLSNLWFDTTPAIRANENDSDDVFDPFGNTREVKYNGKGNNDVFDPFRNLHSVKDSGTAVFDERISEGVPGIAVPVAKSNSDSAVAFQSTDGQKNAHRQNHAARPDDVLKPLPLSLFGDDKADFEQNSEVDLFANHAKFRQKFDSNRAPIVPPPVPFTTGLQFNDFIATLYKQAEKDDFPIPSSNEKGYILKDTGECVNTASGNLESPVVDANNLVGTLSVKGISSHSVQLNTELFENDDQDLESSVWEFKDAFSQHHGKKVSRISCRQECSVADSNNIGDMLSATEMTYDSVPLNTNVFGNNDDDFGSSGWEFKDAFSEPNSKPSGHDFGINGGHVLDQSDHFTVSLEASDDKLKELAVFYTKLRAESHLFALTHLSSLEESLLAASKSNNVEEAATITNEIQSAKKKLGEANDLLKQCKIEEHQFKYASIEAMLEYLPHSSLHAFESVFNLSVLISSAKEDLRTAVDLYIHTVFVLILISTSVKDQSAYLNVWATMISVCATELEHGFNVWSRALDANVNMDILTHPQGKSYFASLIEVFRVSEILRSSVKLYRPWMLLNPDQEKYISLNLTNCMVTWVESGLKEAVCNSLANYNVENPLYSTALKNIDDILKGVESMEQMHLANALFSAARENQHVCRLSLLPANIFEGFKIADWSGQYYFLPLANLWANCVSCEPPQLPIIEFSH